jgi:hypothetical protein
MGGGGGRGCFVFNESKETGVGSARQSILYVVLNIYLYKERLLQLQGKVPNKKAE